MQTAPLNEYGTVKLDGSGNGTLRMIPNGGSETWLPAIASVSATSNAAEAACKIYLGPSPTAPYFVDGTLSGSTGDSTDRVNGLAVDTHGNSLWAVWTGGDPGAYATMVISGTRQTP